MFLWYVTDDEFLEVIYGTQILTAEWQKFMDCFSAKETTDVKKECRAAADDYDECLFHRKESARAQAIAHEYARRQKASEGGDLPQINRKKITPTLEDTGAV